MQMFKKNIILIPADYDGNSNLKGVLTLNFEPDKVKGFLRCYNIKPTQEEYSIGVQIGDNVFKTKASAKELSSLQLQINGSANNSSKVSVAIVSLHGKQYETLLWGSTETTRAMKEHVLIQSLLEKTHILESQQQTFNLQTEPTQIQSCLNNEALEQAQQEIFDDQLLEDYIDREYQKSEVEAESLNKPSVNVKSSNAKSFYNKIENQVEQIFSTSEPDEMLEKIIPDSKFCKVQQQDDYYVFGIIYENGREKCICYGIPSDYAQVPPKEIEGFSQWLPIDPENYQGQGYWMTYQDATTGENIAVEFVD